MSSEVTTEKLIHKGAEASLFYGHWFGRKVIFKHRIPKEYRLEELDKKIRSERTLNEGKALIKVKNYGLSVPQIYEIDAHNSILIMKYIDGKKLKYILEGLSKNKKEKYLKKIGQYIAILHENGHIHGDITTSNIIITEEEEIFLIDFGLHEYSETIEDKSVDLHLFKRVLISTHGNDFEFCFNAFLEGYRSEYENISKTECNQIIKNINAIESRGRYVKPEDR
ncbi:MAG: KEOPS complex kinase/ATPase Bud32 [Promethearchaeota archaeon]|jgi:TP53 regulating kinase-like protein